MEIITWLDGRFDAVILGYFAKYNDDVFTTSKAALAEHWRIIHICMQISSSRTKWHQSKCSSLSPITAEAASASAQQPSLESRRRRGLIVLKRKNESMEIIALIIARRVKRMQFPAEFIVEPLNTSFATTSYSFHSKFLHNQLFAWVANRTLSTTIASSSSVLVFPKWRQRRGKIDRDWKKPQRYTCV